MVCPAVLVLIAALSPLLAGQDSDCLKCHAGIRAVLEKGTRHRAVAEGCTICHLNHRDAGAGRGAGQAFLVAEQPGLCGLCHDNRDPGVVVAHRGQPFQKSRCTACHDPHGSAQPRLIRERQHEPFAAGQCEACHAAPQGGNVRLKTAGTGGVCGACHDRGKLLSGRGFEQHSKALSGDRSCTECHDPHAADTPYLLKNSAAKAGARPRHHLE